MKLPDKSQVWSAPERLTRFDHSMSLPGSKSQTNRELVLAALADGPSVLRRPLHSRDTHLMRRAMEALGAKISELETEGVDGADLRIEPIKTYKNISSSIDCGLAGTVMRFVPPLAAAITGEIHFDGDFEAKARPMAPTLSGLLQLGLKVESEDLASLPFTVISRENTKKKVIKLDSSGSSQFLSGFLLVGARLPAGLKITHEGPSVPSRPHIEMTISCLENRGVEIQNPDQNIWEVRPGPISGCDTTIESDLSNAAPFFAAAVIVGGKVELKRWSSNNSQVGLELPKILEKFGAQSKITNGGIRIFTASGVRAGPGYPGVNLDLAHAGELAPTLIALSLFAKTPSVFRGIGHLRGHETNRLAGLVENIRTLGGDAEETADGLTVRPQPLQGGLWKAFSDHRMATAGAVIGLVVPGVVVDNIESTSKTLPEFVELWESMVGRA